MKKEGKVVHITFFCTCVHNCAIIMPYSNQASDRECDLQPAGTVEERKREGEHMMMSVHILFLDRYLERIVGKMKKRISIE